MYRNSTGQIKLSGYVSEKFGSIGAGHLSAADPRAVRQKIFLADVRRTSGGSWRIRGGSRRIRADSRRIRRGLADKSAKISSARAFGGLLSAADISPPRTCPPRTCPPRTCPLRTCPPKVLADDILADMSASPRGFYLTLKVN